MSGLPDMTPGQYAAYHNYIMGQNVNTTRFDTWGNLRGTTFDKYQG